MVLSGKGDEWVARRGEEWAESVQEAVMGFVDCTDVVMEPLLAWEITPRRLGLAGLGLLSLFKCSNICISANQFDGMHGVRFGIRVEQSNNVHIERCAFIDCGLVVIGECMGVVVKDCKMVCFNDLSRMDNDQGSLIMIQSTYSNTSVELIDCEFRTLLRDCERNCDNVTNGSANTVSPCFLNVHGSVKLVVSGCKVVGPIGSIDGGSSFAFTNCTFDIDPAIVSLLPNPIPVHQVCVCPTFLFLPHLLKEKSFLTILPPREDWICTSG